MKRIFLLLLVGLLFGCNPENRSYETWTGETMGTTYNIILETVPGSGLKTQIDSLLSQINKGVSTYDPKSIISLFNSNSPAYSEIVVQKADLNAYMTENFKLSQDIYRASEGVFDPTVMPLVNYWGFGYDHKTPVSSVDSIKVDSLLNFVGMDLLQLNDGIITKSNPAIQLDFSAIAKGYAVDKVALLLKLNGVDNYFVEIGGEVFAEGVNASGQIWRTGINVPSPVAGLSDIQEVVSIEKKGIATSGNYRNFYVVDGKIYSHTINPGTGFPERNDLLSATVIAPDCATADGFATACMVLGFEGARTLIESREDLEGILIYSDDAGNMLTFRAMKN